MGLPYAGSIALLFILGLLTVYHQDTVGVPGAQGTSVPSLAVAAVLWALAMFLLYACLRTRYTFSESGLQISTLMSKREISYSSITEIRDVSCFTAHNLAIFSPDMVHIKYDKNRDTRISPVRKPEFLSKLRMKCPLAR
jgi:hypothetical protein